MHPFLFNRDGGLSKPAEYIPEIRKYIQNKNKLAQSFKVKEIPTEDGTQLRGSDINGYAIEFLKSWQLPESFAKQNKTKKYILPNYKHRSEYTDIVFECECGAKLSNDYNMNNSNVRDEHNHSKKCKSFMRLESRAKIQRKRWRKTKELLWLGWNGKEISQRFNMTPGSLRSFINRNDRNFNEMRKLFKRAAGNTYTHLVHNENLPAKEASDIYNTHRATLNEWYRDYGDEWVKDFKMKSPRGSGMMWRGEYWND